MEGTTIRFLNSNREAYWEIGAIFNFISTIFVEHDSYCLGISTYFRFKFPVCDSTTVISAFYVAACPNVVFFCWIVESIQIKRLLPRF